LVLVSEVEITGGRAMTGSGGAVTCIQRPKTPTASPTSKICPSWALCDFRHQTLGASLVVMVFN